jgi:hypothetical protein
MDYYFIDLLTLIGLSIVFFVLALDADSFPKDIIEYVLAMIFSGTTSGVVIASLDPFAVIVALGFFFLCMLSMLMVIVKSVVAFGNYSRGKWDNHRI